MKSLKNVLVLGKLNAQEWIRLKFFHIVIFFGFLFIFFSHLLSSLTFAVQERLLYDFGLGGLELALVIIASLIGTHSIQREIDRKTMLLILSRPIPRGSIVVGSWFSIFILNCISCFGFLLSFYLTADVTVKISGLLIAASSSMLKSFLIAAFALAMSILVRPILALATAVSYWFFCHSIPDIEFFVEKIENKNIEFIFSVIKKITPEFYNYNWKSYYYVANEVGVSQIGWMFFHNIAWIAVWLFLAVIFFQRKEIV